MSVVERLIQILDRTLTVEDLRALPERELIKLEGLLFHWNQVAAGVNQDMLELRLEEEPE